jgi:signal transduction histidine kinase
MVFITDVTFIDRDVYTELFNKVSRLPFQEVFETYSYEPLFLLLTKLISLITQNESIYYVLLYIFFVVILLKGLRFIVGKANSVYAFMFFLHFWVFYEYVLNGLRQGLAMAFILLAIGYALEKKSFKVIISSVCAALFHYSSFPIAVLDTSTSK